MNEFWAIVLGAALATVGGIIGAFVNNYINKKNEKENEKKEAYVKILVFCNEARAHYGTFMEELKLDELGNLFTLYDLYLSRKAKDLFDSFIQELNELNKKETRNESICYANAEEIQEKLVIQIKRELKL